MVTKASRIQPPSGWRLINLQTKERYPLLKAKVSVGRGGDADLRLSDAQIDAIQCWLETDGQVWKFRQESKQFPTFVDGNAEAYAPWAIARS